jgi:hypothetical protein
VIRNRGFPGAVSGFGMAMEWYKDGSGVRWSLVFSSVLHTYRQTVEKTREEKLSIAELDTTPSTI